MRSSLLLLALLTAVPLPAADLDFKEAFADPARRTASLEKLVPGSRDAFFYRALDQQLRGDQEGFRKTMGDWHTASQDSLRGVSLDGWEALDNRRMLLAYRNDPKASVDELIRKLDLHFDDLRPQADATAALADHLDPSLISMNEFAGAAAVKTMNGTPFHPGAELVGEAHTLPLYGHDALMAEMDQLDSFPPEKVEAMHHLLQDARHPRMVELLKRDFNRRDSPAFGNNPVDGLLTHAQLDELGKSFPAILGSKAFVTAWMATLPTREKASELEPRILAAHLASCRDFILNAPRAVDEIKANVLYHHLRIQRELGNYPLEDFLSYLRLRQGEIAFLTTKEDKSPPVSTTESCTEGTGCEAIRADAELVQALLEHFLAKDDTAKSFQGLITPSAFKELQSKARLLAGSDPTQWSSGLRPQALIDLQKETRVNFAPGRPATLSSEGPAQVRLELKNTPELLVRVFELDLPQIARQGRLRDLAVNIDVDGIVPQSEKRFTFSQPPLQVHQEILPLPELSGPGAWLVECVSGNSSCRTLIRKGQLLPVVDTKANDVEIRVFNETGEHQKEAAAFVGGQKVAAGADGVIHIPYGSTGSSVWVQAGKLVADAGSVQPASLALNASFHLDAEQVLPNVPVKALLHLTLNNHDHRLPLDRLGKTRVALKLTLAGGLEVEHTLLQDVKLQEHMEIPFQIPDRTSKITLTVSGEASSGPDQAPESLQSGYTWEIAHNENVVSPFFSRDDGGFYLELRGKNGEPYPGHPVTIDFTHKAFNKDNEVSLHLKTDASGRIRLGALDQIRNITVSGEDLPRFFFTAGDQLEFTDLPMSIQVPLGDEIRLPLGSQQLGGPAVSLFQTGVKKRIIADHTAALKQDGREVVIRDLPEGHFILRMGDEHEIDLEIVAAIERGGEMIRSGVAWKRYNPRIPVIAKAQVEGEDFVVRLQHPVPGSHVQIIARRFLQNWDSGDALYAAGPGDSLRTQFEAEVCDYLVDRRLSDESRYILERRQAAKFPGSMLPRPSLLLNRWTKEATTSETQSGQEGSGGVAKSISRSRTSTSDDGYGGSASNGEAAESLNASFLAQTSRVFYQLTPDAAGTVRIPLKNLGGAQVAEIMANAVEGGHTRVFSLPAAELPLRDLRLNQPLDGTRHYVNRRNSTTLTAGTTTVIEGAQDADWRTFGTLGDAFHFLDGAMRGSPAKLSDFLPLRSWNRLNEQDKLAFVADHECHELDLFLARKDKPFFEQYVRPRLQQKREPQMIDDLLLGRDLSGYLKPFGWDRLNAAEKALLAQALPDSRERISHELDQRWESEAPTPEQQDALFAMTLGGKVQDEPPPKTSSLGTVSGSSYIASKLKNIIIPLVEFDDTTVEEAVDFLRLRARELDTLELDPSKKGINIVVRTPRRGTGDASDGDPGAILIRELRLRNVPLAEALRYVCDATRLRFKVDDYAVTLLPATETGEDLVSRQFTVTKDQLNTLGWRRSKLPIKDQLKNIGIAFPEGATVVLSYDTLTLRNTPSNVAMIEQLLSKAAQDTGGEMLEPASDSAPSDNVSDPFASSDPFAPSTDARLLPVPGAEEESKALKASQPRETPGYRREGLAPWEAERDSTQVWHEQNYYRSRRFTDESFIGLNGFWLDLARWDGKGSFLSPHFNECTHHLNEALMCLALLDLPFEAATPEITQDGSALHIKPSTPTLLFYRETKAASAPEADAPVLLRQIFHPLGDRFHAEKGRQIENTISGNFIAGVPYGMSLVVTNPSGGSRRVDLLAQIPAGAIPLNDQSGLLAGTRNLKPYGVLNETLSFYFPEAGSFPVYPLHVSEEDKVVASAAARTLKVVAKAEPEDATSWSSIARDGSPETVLAKLRTSPLANTDLSLIRWRLQDRGFFEQVRSVLEQRMSSDSRLLDYGFFHRDEDAMRTLLDNTSLSLREKAGLWLDTPLLQVRPRELTGYETMEFDTLVNPRAHRFADYPRLSHPGARAAYERLLDVLSWKPALDDEDRLALCSALLLQDRVEEALKTFDAIAPAKLTTQLQYDYLHAVVLFFRHQPQEARAIAIKHLSGPPEMWVKRFTAVVSQADEIAKAAIPDKTAAPETASAPALTLSAMPEHRLQIESARLKNTELKFYQVDLEMLFSKNPFLSGESGELPETVPSAVQQVNLDASGKTLVEIPERFRGGNVLVTASSGETRALRILDSPALTISRQPLDRTLQVTDTATHAPLPEVYVKVYAMTADGQTTFHKDGYTDLRGKFDYLTLPGENLGKIRKLAILTLDPQKGARVEIVDQL